MKKKKFLAILISYIVFSFIFQPGLIPSTNYSDDFSNKRNLKLSAITSGTKQWINNSGFDTPIYPWYNETSGDITDVNVSLNNEMANFIINGEQRIFNNISGTPKNGEWIPGNESEISINPDNYGINEYGAWADNHYQEGGGNDQSRNNPIIQWNKNVTMPINMRDYSVTYANIAAIFNGSADLNIETPYDSIPTGYAAEYDHTRFYVLISDLEKIEQYEIAYNQTLSLGQGNSPMTGVNGTSDNITYTIMKRIDEDDLVFYLNRVLERDYRNFTITLGIDIYNEDNYDGFEWDTWNYLYINSCNLTFNYTKKIDQLSSISWKQDGQKISDLSKENDTTVVATGAKLSFKYKIDKNWSTFTSDQNSEINIYLNGVPYSIPIKLSNVNTTGFEEISINLPPPADSVNLTIELLLREDFILDRTITFTIDNVTLDISYKIYGPDTPIVAGGNGGKTKVIRGPDYTPIVIGLTAGIIGLVSIFAAYQLHYKNPPVVRKIRKLKKNVKKGRKTKPLLLNKREELTAKRFTNQMHQVIELEKIRREIDVKESNVTKIKKLQKEV